MKKQPRAAAFDDGKFSFRKGRVVLAGVIVRLPSYVEGAMLTDCEIDGRDAGSSVIRAISNSRLREQVRVILLDGIAAGGFNIYDLDWISSSTGLPVISVTRRPPDIGAMERALRKHFSDWEERLELVRRYAPRRIGRPGLAVYSRGVGLTEDEEAELLLASIVRGNYPEPLRLAHIFAGAASAGESRGKA